MAKEPNKVRARARMRVRVRGVWAGAGGECVRTRIARQYPILAYAGLPRPCV
jgi:hypothetical protein